MLKTALKDVSVGTIVRLIVLVVSVINGILSMYGTYQIPALDDTTQNALAILIMAIVSLVSYWCNNSWSNTAKTGDKVIDTIKNAGVDAEEVLEALEAIIKKKETPAATETSDQTKVE